MKNARIEHPGDFLRKQIEQRGFTLRQFSDAASFDYTYLRRLLNGGNRITLHNAMRLAKALKMPHQELIRAQELWDEGQRS